MCNIHVASINKHMFMNPQDDLQEIKRDNVLLKSEDLALIESLILKMLMMYISRVDIFIWVWFYANGSNDEEAQACLEKENEEEIIEPIKYPLGLLDDYLYCLSDNRELEDKKDAKDEITRISFGNLRSKVVKLQHKVEEKEEIEEFVISTRAWIMQEIS
ncbi:hypothetical protein ACJX0J_031007 [Zea mays]